MSLRTTDDQDRSLELRDAIDHTGYYPDVVTDSLAVAIAGEPITAFVLQHEPTFDRDEVRRLEERQGFGIRDPLSREGLVEDLCGHAGTASPWTKRRFGTRSSSPASRASSRNVNRAARSRGPKL